MTLEAIGEQYFNAAGTTENQNSFGYLIDYTGQRAGIRDEGARCWHSQSRGLSTKCGTSSFSALQFLLFYCFAFLPIAGYL